jgi:hypothetical protein
MREYVHSSYARMTASHAGAGGGRSTCAPTAAEADAPDGVSEDPRTDFQLIKLIPTFALSEVTLVRLNNF